MARYRILSAKHGDPLTAWEKTPLEALARVHQLEAAGYNVDIWEHTEAGARELTTAKLVEAATVLQALGYALLDKELYPKMETFYFTYGTDKNFPFQGGWTEVHAADRNQAVALFRREHPDRSPGLVNCSSIYTEKQFQDKVLPLYKDGDAFWRVCHECITPEGVTHPLMENRPDMDQLLHQFVETYGRLYDNPELYGKESATARAAFDEKTKSDPWYKSLVQDFVKARQDFISSDREAAAFEIALQTCLHRQQKRKPDLESQMKAAGERAGTQQPTTLARNDLTK